MIKKYSFISLSIIIAISFLLYITHGSNYLKPLSSYTHFNASCVNCVDTLVLFDVDETLITQNMVSYAPPFIIYLLLYFPQLLCTQTFEYVYSKLWEKAQLLLIEKESINLINTLKDQGCTVLGFTAMQTGSYGVIKNMPQWRINTLKRFGIEFTHKFGNAIFTNLNRYRGYYPEIYKGIIFANLQPKGKVLASFLKHFKLHPKKIIMFDNLKANLESVYATCKKLNIIPELYLYTGAARLVCFDRKKIVHEIKQILKPNKKFAHI